MKEKYGTTLDGREWEINLERKRLVSIDNPKLVRVLSKKDMKHIKELIKKKNGRKNKM